MSALEPPGEWWLAPAEYSAPTVAPGAVLFIFGAVVVGLVLAALVMVWGSRG